MNNNNKISVSSFSELINPEDINTSLKRVYGLGLFLIILVIILVYLKWNSIVDNLTKDSLLISSIGLLTFISIFFSLLAKKDIEEKLSIISIDMEKYEKDEQNKYETQKEKARQLGLEKEFDQKYKPNLEFIIKAKRMLKLEIFLFLTVISLKVSILAGLLNYLAISFVSFITGTIGILYILVIWLIVTSEDIRKLMKSKN